MPRLARRLAPPLALLLLVAMGLSGPGAVAGDPGDDDPPVGAGPDLGDQNVPFEAQVNQAIEQGVEWLRNRASLFSIPGTRPVADGASWGLVKGDRAYGGGDGPQYRHPAGPTALALYTLLKCGVSPKEPIIERGFAWLASVHTITPEWDGQETQGRTRVWTHLIAGSSYELAAMILALTAKYDQYKKSAQSDEAQRRHKLRIKDRDDRVWLDQLVTALLERRGQPLETATALDAGMIERLSDPSKAQDPPKPEGDLPPHEQRLGWRYNVPHLDLFEASKAGRSSWQRRNNVPPNANQDLSSTQLATLALFSARRFGMKIPDDVWFDILDFTLAHQEEDGPEQERYDPTLAAGGYAQQKDHARGFMYIKGSPDGTEGVATGSMTACGITNLLIAVRALEESPKGRKEFSERGLDRKVTTAVWDGLAWLDRNWSPFMNPSSQYGYHVYYLYAIEREQDLRMKNLLGKHLWYREGAREILQRQQHAKVKDLFDGRAPERDVVFWNTGSTHEPKDVLDTCFALLFLKRATSHLSPAPVTPGDEAGPTDSR